jgi:signal transduction histidine kinase
MRLNFNSLAFRLFATSVGWTLLVLPLAGWLICSLYSDDVQVGFDNNLIKLVDGIALDSLATEGNEPDLPVNRYEPLFEVPNSGFYWQVKPLDVPTARKLVSPSLATGTLVSPFELKFPADKTGKRWMNTTGPNGKAIRIVEVVNSVNYSADTPHYSVIVAGPHDWIDDLIARFRSRLVVALTLAGLGLLAVTAVQIGFALAPLRRIERGLAAVRSGDAKDLAGSFPTEIEPLQVELNALLKSNQDIIERARTQVGNLAHALKTPLAVITNEARDHKGDFAAKVTEQAQIMRDQVTNYLDRARMAAIANVIGRATPVQPVAESLVRALERINRDKGVSITLICAPGLRFQGEKADLEEMLGNLLDNACKWSRSSVYLTAAALPQPTRSSHKMLSLIVEDDGNGLTADQRGKIGKRGLRLDESTPGTGLGLSIVADFATSYRGTLALDASPHGGLLVRLELPAV